jgi:hypothetical protein
MDQIKTMRLAMQALRNGARVWDAMDILEAGIKTAQAPESESELEQPGQTNPWRDAVDHELSTLHMVASDDPRESIRRLIDWHCAVQIDPLVSSAAQELIERGRREALEQPEQEPVAHLWQHSETGRTRVVMPDQVVTADATWVVVGPLYLHPPRREWRGLSEPERHRLWRKLAEGEGIDEYGEAIEQALKERNA